MKYCCQFFTILYLTTSVCFSVEQTPEDYPTIEENLQQADALLRQLELEFSQHLAYKQGYLELVERHFGDEERAKQELKVNKKLKKKILEENKKFLAFRENTIEILSLNYGGPPYGDYLCSVKTLEMTEWYVNFMREMVFP